ncbi:MAG: zinc ABC transporter substrate-binding protein [Microbacterium sp.]
MRHAPLALAAAAASVLLLAGCTSEGAGAGSASPDDTVHVVASTNVYGQIVEEVGGDRVEVSSIIASTAQDPHEFEASASDQLLVQDADLLVENGGGFDPFLDAMAQAAGSAAPVVTAVELSSAWPGDDEADDDGVVEGFNEHVFYDPATMALVADAIAQQLGTLDPDHADDFAKNAADFATGVQGVEDALTAIADAHAGATVFVTEPLPLYLTEAAGLENVTPEDFSEAVEEGQDVPPATLLEALQLVPTVAVLITNEQAAGAETTQVEETATDAGVPVLKFSEILPEGTTYLGWMQDNTAQLAAALGS